jgi:hypothetical protein
MPYSLTIFNSIFDNKTEKRMDFDNWASFERLLYQLSKQPGRKPKRGERGKKASALISPAIYAEGTTRANANVLQWAGWAALDVDRADKPLDDMLEPYRQYYFICYSTASSTVEKPKFRVLFPLTCPVGNKEIRHFWYALNKHFGGMADEQTKDLSRMYYVPAQYPNAHNFIFTNTGKCLDPYSLMPLYPYVERQGKSFMDKLPDSIQKAILELEKDKMTNRDVVWSSYRDCPFVNRKLVNEYRTIANTDGSGRYLMIYKIMTSIACNAVRRKYPISPGEVAELVRQLDAESSRIYQNRPLRVEAERAIEYAYRSVSS